jgi:hypothetical protein
MDTGDRAVEAQPDRLRRVHFSAGDHPGNDASRAPRVHDALALDELGAACLPPRACSNMRR